MTFRSTAVLATITVYLCASAEVTADPLHSRAGGDYWHHDSGWIFPIAIGPFERVGVPQDVAGSSDAVAYYARELQGIRIVASVDVVAGDSMAERLSVDGASSQLALGTKELAATRVIGSPSADASVQVLYVVDSGEWSVRVLAQLPADVLAVAGLDDFVRTQRWDTLP